MEHSWPEQNMIHYRAVFTWLSKGIDFGFGFGFTTPFAWLVYLLWFWFYDSQVKNAIYRILHRVCICDIYAELLTYQKSAEWTVPWLATLIWVWKIPTPFQWVYLRLCLATFECCFTRLNKSVCVFCRAAHFFNILAILYTFNKFPP